MKEILESSELLLLSAVATGFIINRIWERFNYYRKTGKHLDDL